MFLSLKENPTQLRNDEILGLTYRVNPSVLTEIKRVTLGSGVRSPDARRGSLYLHVGEKVTPISYTKRNVPGRGARVGLCRSTCEHFGREARDGAESGYKDNLARMDASARKKGVRSGFRKFDGERLRVRR